MPATRRRCPWNRASSRRTSSVQRRCRRRPSNASRSRIGSVLAIVGAGLLLVGLRDALGRTGPQSPVVPLFLAGLTCIVAPCAWRLTGAAAGRSERLWVSVVLGLALQASYLFRSPLIFDNFDELAHGATLTRLLDSRVLFQDNPSCRSARTSPGSNSRRSPLGG